MKIKKTGFYIMAERQACSNENNKLLPFWFRTENGALKTLRQRAKHTGGVMRVLTADQAKAKFGETF